MARHQLTIDDEMLHSLFENDDGIARLLEEVLNQILDAQTTDHLKAMPYERSEERQGYRNGYRSRELKTRVGSLELRIPRVRDGSFSTELFGRYQRSEQALVLALMEMVVNGVSTRKVQNITEELCGTSFSKSTVSDLCKGLDPLVRQWNWRALETEYPFVLVDAMVFKSREGGRVRYRSAHIAVGISHEGYREVLGLGLGDSESESSWSDFFHRLRDRGLRGVDLVVSDDHGGLVKAAHKHFEGATWQRCQTHLKRNVLDKVPKSQRDELSVQLKVLFDAPDAETARHLLEGIFDKYSKKLPRAMQCLEDGFEDAIAVMALPAKYRRRLRSTNMVERLIREIRRREKVIGIFPNMDSALRLLGAYLMERDEDWISGKKYFDMTDYWEFQDLETKTQDEAAN